jgi:phage protein D
MPVTWQLLLNGQQADPDLYTLIGSVDVEESMDLPGAIEFDVTIARSSTGDLTNVDDSRFAPLASVAVVATAGGDAGAVVGGAVGSAAGALGTGGAPSATQCIFDGYVLSQKIHLETGTTNSTLTVWGQDASWLMNLTEKVKEWVDVTDADVAAAIFNDYGITPSDQNTQDDSSSHTADGHSLMQRGSDIQFLRTLARRSGKVLRVASTDTPGVRTGYFAKPQLDGDPALTITLNDPTNWTVSALDLQWDVTRPTSVVARQALFSDASSGGVSADTSDSGLELLGDRDLATFAGKPMTVMLAAPVDSAGELTRRAQAVLRDADWFVRCEGEADVERLGMVLRAGMVVSLVGIGALHSGRYLVWSVRHHISQDAHGMKFVLLRNAVGNPPTNGAASLASVAGSL